MFKVNISKPTVKYSGATSYLRFDLELWDEACANMLHRSVGWRVINGYISPPKSQTPRGYMAVMTWHPAILTAIWQAIKPIYESAEAKHEGFAQLKDCELAIKEGCLPDKYLNREASA